MRAKATLARSPWRTLRSRTVYENRWIRVREDEAGMPDGRTTPYAVVECPAAVGVVPFVDPDHVLLVGQWRYVAQDFFWEIPTGGVLEGEDLQAAAQRELTEEAGFAAERLTALCEFHSSKSVVRETAHLFLAEDLRPALAAPDGTEFIETAVFPFGEALAMVERSEIKDAMSVIGLLHVARLRGR
jgi:ADP-ribose pyrophosphatase